MLQACETDVTFVLKLILQTQGEYVVFPILFISLYEVALFVEVEFVIGLHADMFVETVHVTFSNGGRKSSVYERGRKLSDL